MVGGEREEGRRNSVKLLRIPGDSDNSIVNCHIIYYISDLKEGGQLFGDLTLCRTGKKRTFLMVKRFIEYLQVQQQRAHIICSVVIQTNLCAW